jgi:hypothetical protein
MISFAVALTVGEVHTEVAFRMIKDPIYSDGGSAMLSESFRAVLAQRPAVERPAVWLLADSLRTP